MGDVKPFCCKIPRPAAFLLGEFGEIATAFLGKPVIISPGQIKDQILAALASAYVLTLES
jgi:hypothetical protein